MLRFCLSKSYSNPKNLPIHWKLPSSSKDSTPSTHQIRLFTRSKQEAKLWNLTLKWAKLPRINMKINEKFTHLNPFYLFILYKNNISVPRVQPFHIFGLHAADSILLNASISFLPFLLSFFVFNKRRTLLVFIENVLEYEYTAKLNYLYISEAKIQIILFNPIMLPIGRRENAIEFRVFFSMRNFYI